MHELFSIRPFFARIDKGGLIFGWKDINTNIEWKLMAYSKNELIISLTNFRELPKAVRDVVRILAETNVLEDLNVKL